MNRKMKVWKLKIWKNTRYPIRKQTVLARYAVNVAKRSIEYDIKTFYMAMEYEDAAKWRDAIDDKLCYFDQAEVWEIVDRQKKGRVIFCMWVLRKKRTAKGEIIRYKAHMIIYGNQDDANLVQKFAPVVQFTFVRLILAVST